MKTKQHKPNPCFDCQGANFPYCKFITAKTFKEAELVLKEFQINYRICKRRLNNGHLEFIFKISECKYFIPITHKQKIIKAFVS